MTSEMRVTLNSRWNALFPAPNSSGEHYNICLFFQKIQYNFETFSFFKYKIFNFQMDAYEWTRERIKFLLERVNPSIGEGLDMFSDEPPAVAASASKGMGVS